MSRATRTFAALTLAASSMIGTSPALADRNPPVQNRGTWSSHAHSYSGHGYSYGGHNYGGHHYGYGFPYFLFQPAYSSVTIPAMPAPLRDHIEISAEPFLGPAAERAGKDKAGSFALPVAPPVPGYK